MKLIALSLMTAAFMGAGVEASKASVVVVGPVMNGGTYTGSSPRPRPETTSFDDEFTFSSLTSFEIDISLLTTVSNPANLTNVTYALYKGLVGSGTLVSSISATINGTATNKGTKYLSAEGSYSSDGLGAGNYYFELSGRTSAKSSIGNTVNFNVSAVPLPNSLPMFGAALLALGGVAFLRSRRSSEQTAANAIAA